MFIPDLIAQNSQRDPSRPFYIYAQPDSKEITTITHLEFGRATHRAANILRPDGEGQNGEVVAIIALSDTVLYQAIVAGLMTANCIPFPISPRNSAPGVFQLLRASSCHRLIATCTTVESLLGDLNNHISEVDPEFALKVEEVPSLQQVYPNLGAETLDSLFQPYHRLPSEAESEPDEIALYLHSSGSTRLPRAVGQTHRLLKQWFAAPAITEIGDDGEHWGPMGVMALPPFHIYGLYQQLMQPLSGTCCAVFPPMALVPSALPLTPSPDSILEHAQRTNCRSLVAVAVLLVAWFDSPAAMAYLKTLDNIIFSGGSPPQRIGDALVDAGLHLVNVYGGTEFGPLSTMIQNEEDKKEWAWFRFSPQTWENYTPMVENLSDVRGYATSDLCVNHPCKKDLWKLVGRLDDVIVHSSAEKTVPGPMEDIVMGSPYVATAVMFGQGRAQAGILIEIPPNLQVDVRTDSQLTELRDKVWPVIEEANMDAPAFSRIFKELILFASPDKPLPRAATKGTVLRKAALALYAPEIESIYNAVQGDDIEMTDGIEATAQWDADRIQVLLLKLAGTLCGTEISPTEDLFKQGFDSLIATIFRLRIMKALRSKNLAEAENANFVYSHPTIAKLAIYVAAMVSGATEDTGPKIQGIKVARMITKHSTTGIARTDSFTDTFTAQSAVVLLTGSTGNLGSQLLASLLKDGRVRRIYAFNRASGRTLADRHLDTFKQRGLDILLLACPKLVFVEGQADQPHLGLSRERYEEMRTSVTLIIHNAWTLDFNMVLSSFEPHILGTRHLIELALASSHSPRFLFSSSIASSLGWDLSLGPCPEDILSDPSLAIGGYGQSKYVAEQILAKSGLNATCFRIGQVCGALPRGAWATSDWFPILVKTSITLGQLPLADGANGETVAQAMVDVAFSSPHNSEPLPVVLNLVHPQPVSWNFVINRVRNALKEMDETKDLQLTTFPDWYGKLEGSEDCSADVAENLPGLKLLDFFHRLANSSVASADGEFGGITFSVGKIRSLSSAICNATKLTDEMKAWVEYWHQSGFL
ncbi:hypothetical protein K438DRAFT_1985842 [Mycena galopus ATCC 62051]|nr:hypothetical protein K438DRAFT_1985842 [Mycena galopus ATCC 62051]